MPDRYPGTIDQMRVLAALPLVLAAAVVALAATHGAPQPPAVPAAKPIRCKAGTVKAVILGKQHCLRAGQRCNARYDRLYRRYGFRCRGGRLARLPTKPKPKAQPTPTPSPTPTPRSEPPDGTIVFAGLPKDGAYVHYDGPLPLPKPTYSERPPVGGDHGEYWARCRFFTEPLDEVLAVHSLEHGAVWLAYRPDLPADELTVLRALVDGTHEILASPFPGLTEAVVAVAWARQLRLGSVSDPRLVQFVDAFHDAPHSPQDFIHTCFSAVG